MQFNATTHTHQFTDDLYANNREEFEDLQSLMETLRIYREDIKRAGGNKSEIVKRLEQYLYNRGWRECRTAHTIDAKRRRVAVEFQWNSKDGVFSRDLGSFKALHESGEIDCGVIITRCTSLDSLLKRLGVFHKYGASTTHLQKLLPRLAQSEAGTCPVLGLGINETFHYVDRDPLPFFVAA